MVEAHLHTIAVEAAYTCIAHLALPCFYHLFDMATPSYASLIRLFGLHLNWNPVT